MNTMARAGTALTAALLTCLAVLVPGAPRARADTEPILFVHGYGGNGGRWSTMIDRFEADGWPADRLFTIDYDSTRSNVAIAADIRARVDAIRSATGAAKVTIVAMSMGSLNSRHYLKFLGGTTAVSTWISLAGPNHGTTATRFCPQDRPTCQEMRIGSPFLTELNSGDETPGDVAYGTLWSDCDTVVNPDSSVSLAGAVNTYAGCLSHAAFLTDASVYAKVRDFVS
ncbi:esterase/lipase family protein [Nonomuraea sp. CA-218870]|uniref:esterase/lipase family protein n=1 Tax=Nonomuraea sp. CA-218870 TaxID=3239998 RepID=UPI003D92731E